MHHSLRLYSANRKWVIRFYIFMGEWTRIPVIGRLVRRVFRNCSNPIDVEILLGPTRHIFLENMPHDSHEISKEEAKEIIKDCHRKGLIHTIIKCRNHFYAICNCCSCCCVPLRLSKHYGIGNALGKHKDIVREFKEHQLLHQSEQECVTSHPSSLIEGRPGHCDV